MKDRIPLLIIVAGVGSVALDTPASTFEAARSALKRDGYIDGFDPSSGKKACIYQRYIITMGERVDMQQVIPDSPHPIAVDGVAVPQPVNGEAAETIQ